jgi:hypothetical protein
MLQGIIRTEIGIAIRRDNCHFTGVIPRLSRRTHFIAGFP